MAAGPPRSDRLRRRRRFWRAVAVVLIVYLIWAWSVGLAFTTGMPAAEMDWNADGAVSTGELLQAGYAVTAQTTRTQTGPGLRVCRSYRWLGDGDAPPLRVSCRTEVGAAR